MSQERKKKITVLLVNYNTSEFVGLLLYSLYNLTQNYYQVIICDNGSNDMELIKLSHIVRKYKDVNVFFRLQSQHGSIGHSEALDILIEKVNTKYTVILDSDCVLLMKGWDQYMINQMDEHIKIVGSSEIDGVKVDRFGSDFVLPFISMFETKIFKDLKISCMPKNLKNGEDTCWEWSKKYKENNYKCSKFIGKSTRNNFNTEFSNIVGIEIYYTLENKLIGSHFGRGSSNGYAKYKEWYFRLIPFLSKYLNNLYGQQQKNKWILKSIDIIKRSL